MEGMADLETGSSMWFAYLLHIIQLTKSFLHEYYFPSNLLHNSTKSQHFNVYRPVLQLSLVYLIHWSQSGEVENGNVAGESPTGDSPTTSKWSTILWPTKVSYTRALTVHHISPLLTEIVDWFMWRNMNGYGKGDIVFSTHSWNYVATISIQFMSSTTINVK